MNELISINKYISDSGFCSRRKADEYIEQLRVTINGVEAQKGNRVNPTDKVCIDGELIKPANIKLYYIILNKPLGITCTTDTKDKSNVIEYIHFKTRIFPIGRLDKQSEGLLFLTNDGDIVNKILRAGNNHEKEYIVTVHKNIQHSDIVKMRNGIRILGTKTLPCFVQLVEEKTIRIILTQGLNRQIRRMCDVLGYKVTSLKRIRIMHITLKGLKPGAWRFFTPAELQTLNEALKKSKKTTGLSEQELEE